MLMVIVIHLIQIGVKRQMSSVYATKIIIDSKHLVPQLQIANVNKIWIKKKAFFNFI